MESTCSQLQGLWSGRVSSDTGVEATSDREVNLFYRHEEASCPGQHTNNEKDGSDTGVCFNCGQTGLVWRPLRQTKHDQANPERSHRAADCTAPRDNTCRYCKAEGHMIRDCPQKPPMVCGNCGQEGQSLVPWIVESSSSFAFLLTEPRVSRTPQEELRKFPPDQPRPHRRRYPRRCPRKDQKRSL